jgi:NMD protein affecting ribosome stability and mRNA decay
MDLRFKILMSLKAKFCAVCGRENSKFIDSTCVDCYFKTLKIDLPKSIVIYACPVCDAVKSEGLWHNAPESHNAYFVQNIVKKLKLPPHVELEDVEILQQGKEGEVEVSISIEGKRFSVVRPMEFYLTDQICELDSKRKREAYEGILQLRPKGNIHDFLDRIENELKFVADNILKTDENSKGVDIYFLDVTTMRHLVGQLKKRFNFYMKISAKEYSWDKTKNRPKYKVTILAREKE